MCNRCTHNNVHTRRCLNIHELICIDVKICAYTYSPYSSYHGVADAVCYGVLRCVAVCCSVLLCVAVYCSVLQCVAGCCIVRQLALTHKHTHMPIVSRSSTGTFTSSKTPISPQNNPDIPPKSPLSQQKSPTSPFWCGYCATSQDSLDWFEEDVSAFSASSLTVILVLSGTFTLVLLSNYFCSRN